MKKYSLITVTALTLATGLLLSGCTDDAKPNDPGASSAPTANFDSNPEITVMPAWNISELMPGMLGGEDNPTMTVETDPNGNEIYTPPVDTYLDNYIYFENPTTKCGISGRINVTDSYKSERGDLYNSKEALYSLGDPTQKPVANEGTVNIEDWGYVTGEYTTVLGDQGSVAHRTAARVFSTPVTVPSGTLPTDLNYQSDPSLGLPTIIIDYTCPTVEAFDDAEWEKALSTIFKLNYAGVAEEMLPPEPTGETPPELDFGDGTTTSTTP